MTGVRFLVSGRVQGVGFRWYVARMAERLELRGYARNLPNGEVEVVAVGVADRLHELEAALRAGPRLSRVTNVEKSQILDELDRFNSFVIM